MPPKETGADLCTRINPRPVTSLYPKRSTVIQEDEITNLVIALNTTSSVKEFLETFQG